VGLGFHALQGAASAARRRALSALATELGYFDQAHFIRDFTVAGGSNAGRICRDVREGVMVRSTVIL
jgi:hypothetical protein